MFSNDNNTFTHSNVFITKNDVPENKTAIMQSNKLLMMPAEKKMRIWLFDLCSKASLYIDTLVVLMAGSAFTLAHNHFFLRSLNSIPLFSFRRFSINRALSLTGKSISP